MATYKQALVEVPDDKGVHIKSAGQRGEKYVYKYTSYFRNQEGQPRNRSKSIGKLDPASGKMYPNANYFDLYKLNPSLPEAYLYDYGYSYIILKVCRDLGLLDCLKKSFGERCMDIIVSAAYMIRQGNAMDGIDDWQARNYFPDYSRLLSSQATSRLFQSLTAEERVRFFKDWLGTAYRGGSVFYDVTSISSYSVQMADVERGYNRDGEDLAQYNLGLFCAEETRLPIYYNRYNGSLTDKTNLPYVLDNARAVGINKVKLVLDGGFWSQAAINSLQEFCQAFTVGMPLYLTEAMAILESYAEGIDRYEYELPDHIYCRQIDTSIYGVAGKVLLFYDQWNHHALCSELSDKIARLSQELAALKRYPNNKLARYSTYFQISKNKADNGFTYEPDLEKIEQLRRVKGYFLLFTTDMAASPSEILYYYRAKDADEKLFDQIKVDMDGRRIRTHSESSTEGKTFVTFVASIIRSHLLNTLSDYLHVNAFSLKKALNQLSNITLLSSQGELRLAKAMTRKQKDILQKFGADKEILASLD